MPEIKVRPFQNGDAEALAPRLRRSDLREIRATSGEQPLAALSRSVGLSDICFSVTSEGNKPLAIFGVATAPPLGSGMVWLLASADLARYRLPFLRRCRDVVSRLGEQYETLWNYIDARNKVHIRWLAWCGFTFVRLVEAYGVERRPFYEFRRVRRDSTCA